MAIAPEQAMGGGGPEPQPPVGLINKPEGALPAAGGEKSVADDVPMKADEGDYVLPYETVLLVGLKDLNRYAREAIDLAMANKVDLGGTDLDPTDDVPIKISNYEYHIPKQLVPFFGGGKKYLDKIREEGLSLRKRLAEEGGKKKEGAPPPQQAEAPAPPPQEQAFAGGQPAPPPQAPMPAPPMQKGGFVLSKDKEADILEKDAPQTAEQQRIMVQQPPMVTPEGKKVQQGFSAPAGYSSGDIVTKKPDEQGVERKRTVLKPEQEDDFQNFYKKYFPHLNPDPDHPLHKYDNRGFFKYIMSRKPEERTRLLSKQEDGYTHGLSTFKDDDHPNRFVRLRDGSLYDTKYEKVMTRDIDEEIEPMTSEMLEQDRSQPAMNRGGFVRK